MGAGGILFLKSDYRTKQEQCQRESEPAFLTDLKLGKEGNVRSQNLTQKQTAIFASAEAQNTVMAGLDPAIHVFACVQDVDARDKRGHDGVLNG